MARDPNEVLDPNEEHLAFYSALGNAITQWAHVEFAISWIVTECLGTRASKVSAAAFFSIENLRSKLLYADTIVLGYVEPKALRADWAVLKDRADKMSTKRNNLAHRWVLNAPDAKPGRRIMLLQFRQAKKKGRSKYPGALCVRDIRRYQLEFSALMVSLENFCARFSGRKEPFPKSLEQPNNPPTLAKIRREIYAFAQRPP